VLSRLLPRPIRSFPPLNRHACRRLKGSAHPPRVRAPIVEHPPKHTLWPEDKRGARKRILFCCLRAVPPANRFSSSSKALQLQVLFPSVVCSRDYLLCLSEHARVAIGFCVLEPRLFPNPTGRRSLLVLTSHSPPFFLCCATTLFFPRAPYRTSRLIFFRARESSLLPRRPFL